MPATRPVSPAEHDVIDALKRVVMLPAHPDKRFLGDVAQAADLTDRQRRRLLRLRWKYRRQIVATVPLLAEARAEAERDGRVR